MIDRFERFSSDIFELTRYWHKIATDELAKFDLKGTYAVYLTVLLRNRDGVTSARLSEICARDKADVSRAIADMEKRRIVEKVRSDKNSLYRAAIRLTDAGVKIASQIINRACLAVELANYDVTENDRMIFSKVLSGYVRTLGQLSEQGLPTPGNIKAVLFDLDGTLLPMDQDVFVKRYFQALVEFFAPKGFNPDKLVKAIWNGTEFMVKNNGLNKNETVFWLGFKEIIPNVSKEDILEFDKFYEVEFDKVKEVCGFNPHVRETIVNIKLKGMRTILATNPFFPSVATKKRLEWAGLSEEYFEYITSYENSHFSKPNIKYYEEILTNAGLKPEECLMVGNDAFEDMIAETLGMKVFLITDNLINKNNIDISSYPQGDFAEFINYIEKL